MKIAYLEDEHAIAEKVCEWLTAAGHHVVWFQNGLECARSLECNHFDAWIFDRNVPGLSGTEVLTRLQIKLRNATPPVIFTTGLDSEEDIVSVLRAGADDYIVKPLSKPLWLARLDAVQRRSSGVNYSSLNICAWGSLTLNMASRQFFIHGELKTLTNMETNLAIYLLQNIGRLLSREILIQVVWGQAPDVATRTIDVHIGSLRRKLQLVPESGWRLVSIYRHGYRLEQQRSS